MEFQKFNKIPRLSRDCIITEKIDGTNGQIVIISGFNLLTDRFCDNLLMNFKHTACKDFIEQYSLFCKDDLYVFAGSRNRWLTCEKDNYGFAKWVKANGEELLKLGEGRHYGEWYGNGIQRGYGLSEKRFALFNVGRWHKVEPRLISIDPQTKEERYTEKCPDCCEVVPIIDHCTFDTENIDYCIMQLKDHGSLTCPGFLKPEGIVIFHSASGQLFKKTIENDEKSKGQNDE